LDQFKDKKYKTKNYGFELSGTDKTQEKGKKEGDGESAL